MNTEIREAMDRAKARVMAWAPGDQDVTWQMAVAMVVGQYDHSFHEMECQGCESKTVDPKEERIAKLERLAVLQADQMASLMGAITIPGTAYEIAVDKSTHRIRFADETESSVRIIIEPNDRPRD